MQKNGGRPPSCKQQVSSDAAPGRARLAGRPQPLAGDPQRRAAASGWTTGTTSALPVPPELFDETTRALPRSGFVGANVTIPHKQAALALADRGKRGRPGDRRREHAHVRRRTATIARGEHRRPRPDRGARELAAAGTRALVLGAGGSARAAVWALREAGASEVSIWNRTPERATALARELGARAVTRRAGRPARQLHLGRLGRLR